MHRSSQQRPMWRGCFLSRLASLTGAGSAPRWAASVAANARGYRTAMPERRVGEIQSCGSMAASTATPGAVGRGLIAGRPMDDVIRASSPRLIVFARAAGLRGGDPHVGLESTRFMTSRGAGQGLLAGTSQPRPDRPRGAGDQQELGVPAGVSSHGDVDTPTRRPNSAARPRYILRAAPEGPGAMTPEAAAGRAQPPGRVRLTPLTEQGQDRMGPGLLQQQAPAAVSRTP